MIKKILLFMLVLSSPVLLYAINGTQIINNAEDYRDHLWTCNDQNARPLNRDEDPNNNIREYPFYPEGAAYLDENREEQTSDGQHTGLPYASGLRDTAGGDGIFSEKIDSEEPNYLAGNTGAHAYNVYAGLDCSGFVSNCVGIPNIRLNTAFYDYDHAYWHPGTDNLKSDYFSDKIRWEDVTKGDIIIRGTESPAGGHMGVVN